MMTPAAFGLLWPTFAMVALIFIVWFSMFFARMGHIRRNPPNAQTFATGESALRYFEPVEMPANNFRNLFEMPMLFFVVVVLLIVTHQANYIQVILAWAYVVLRAGHSFVHIVIKEVQVRAPVYWLSSAVLMAMWIGFAIDVARAETAYQGAMANLSAAQR